MNLPLVLIIIVICLIIACIPLLFTHFFVFLAALIYLVGIERDKQVDESDKSLYLLVYYFSSSLVYYLLFAYYVGSHLFSALLFPCHNFIRHCLHLRHHNLRLYDVRNC